MPLRYSPGAGRDAALAADAQTGLDKDDAVLLSLLHGPGRTGLNAPRIFAVVTGHEDEPHSRLSVDLVGAEGKDLARRRAWTEILVGLAMHFASLAADAIRLVMVKCVHTHAVGPPVARRLIWTMVSVDRSAASGWIEFV